MVDYLGPYRRELIATFANLAAVTQASERSSPGAEPLHYLRTVVPFGPESGVAAASRFGQNRHNPYFAPGGLDKLVKGLESFDCSHQGNTGPPYSAPPCLVQEPFDFRGRRGAYPHVTKDR